MKEFKDYNLDSLHEFIGRENVGPEYGYEKIEIPFEIKPEDFLTSAESEVHEGSKKNLVNALSNIKRAIDCQADCLLIGFGLYELSKKEKWNFPKKIEVIGKIGIIAPRILGKINIKRNFLEHEYKQPTKEEVEDALDVAFLFIGYTQRFLHNAIVEFILMSFTTNEQIRFELDYKKNKIIFNKEKEIPSTSKDYIDYLRWYIQIYQLKLT